MLQKSDLIAIARGKQEISMINFGGVPDGGKTEFTNGEKNYFNVIVDASGGAVRIREAKRTESPNGKYIQQLTNKVAIASAINGQLLVTDQLTGCVWQIWKCGNEIAGAHAYSKGTGEVVSFKSQAKPPKWELLDEYPTAGEFGSGEQGFAFSIVGAREVETVIMAVKDGRTVRPVKIATVFR